MTTKFSWPSFFQRIIWLPIRLLILVGGSAKINGLDNIKATKGNVIIASNHVSELDPLIIVSCLPFFSDIIPLIYVVKGKGFYASNWTGLRKIFYGGFFFNIIGGYEAHSGLNNYQKALANHLKAIKKGFSVCIFPVGRIHNDGDYLEARGGVAYLAAKTGLPIIPMHIKGINRQTSFKDYLKRRPKLTITFGEPIFAQDIFNEPSSSITKSSQRACETAARRVMKKIVKLS